MNCCSNIPFFLATGGAFALGLALGMLCMVYWQENQDLARQTTDRVVDIKLKVQCKVNLHSRQIAPQNQLLSHPQSQPSGRGPELDEIQTVDCSVSDHIIRVKTEMSPE